MCKKMKKNILYYVGVFVCLMIFIIIRPRFREMPIAYLALTLFLVFAMLLANKAKALYKIENGRPVNEQIFGRKVHKLSIVLALILIVLLLFHFVDK